MQGFANECDTHAQKGMRTTPDNSAMDGYTKTRRLAVASGWLVLTLLTGCAAGTPASVPTRQLVQPTAVQTVNAPTVPAATLQQPESTQTGAGTPAPVVNTGSYTLTLHPVAAGFSNAVGLATADDGSDRLYVIEQPGRVWIVQSGQRSDSPFLDIVPLVLSDASERGLLGLAFHPDYRTNRRFIVDYTRVPDGATVIAEYIANADGKTASSTSGKTLLVIPQPEWNHDGGQLQFGPDGYLYIGMGDGGGGGDQHGPIGNGQNLNALLGKILRIDVSVPGAYTPAKGNPFIGKSNAQPEIWAYGLRNPWRFSFDRANGDLYIGDVGQDLYEEIDYQPARSIGGENYGWRIMEGLHCYQPAEGCNQTGLTLPVAEYDHSSGCAVIGGYVYRGERFPWLQGVYFYADYCSGTVWALQRQGDGTWHDSKVLETHLPITSFGQDARGELYAVEFSGGLYRLDSALTR